METEPTPIFHCEVCLRCFTPQNGDIVLMDPQPSLAVPEKSFVCGRGDCHPPPPPPMPTACRKPAQPKPDCRSGNLSSAAKKLRSAPSSASFVRGCPSEIESVGSGEIVPPDQRGFKEAVDTSGSVQKLLQYFKDHYGEFVPMLKLKEVAGIEVPHSRIPELRALLDSDHVIYNVSQLYAPSGKAHSHYRLCRKDDEKYLQHLAALEDLKAKREQKKREREGVREMI